MIACLRRGIALEVDLEEHLHYATDPELWERLLQNMLSNVLKHGKDQARLTLMSDEDTIRVELRNIVQQPIQHLDQLASRFYSEIYRIQKNHLAWVSISSNL